MALINIQILVFVFAAFASLQVVRSAGVCTAIGTQCSDDCKDVVLCPNIGDTPIVTVPCFSTNGRYCVENGVSGNFECTANQCSNPNAPHPFQCTGAGTFPSAYSCDTSYICAGANQVPSLECRCDSNEYFDVNTGTCLSEPGCPLIPADCTATGQTAELGNGFCYTCDLYHNALVFHCGPTTTTTTPAPPVSAPPARRRRDTRGLSCTPYVPPKMSYDV